MSYGGYNNNGRTFRQGPGFVESEYISPDGSSYEFEQFKKTDNVEDYVHESYHQSSPRNNYHVPAIGFGGSFGGGLGHTSPLGGLGHTSPRPISPSYGASSFDRSPRGSPNDFSNHAILRLDQLRQEAEARINELRQRANDAFARMRNQSQYPVQDFAYPPLPSPRPFDGRTSPLRQDHTYTNPYSQPSYNPSLSSPSRYSPSNTAPYHSPSSHLPYSSSPTLAPYSSSPSYRPQSSSPHSSSYNPSTYQPYSSPSYRPQTSSPSSYQPHTGYGQGYGAGGGGGGSGLPGYGSYTSGGGYGPSAGSYGYGSPSSYNSYGNKPTKVDTKPSTLKVTVVRANGLREDRYRTIDPYVVLTLDTQRFQTSVKSGSTPFWGESFSFDLNRTAQTLLKVEVIDSTTRDKLGWDWVQLRTAPAGVRVPVQVQLKTGGTLTLELDGGPSSASPYSPGSLNTPGSISPYGGGSSQYPGSSPSRPGNATTPSTKPTSVRVIVDRGIQLKGMDVGSKSDPFVKLSLGKQQTFQTKTKNNTNDPVWGEEFTFDLSREDTTLLKVEVFDKDVLSQNKIGYELLDLKKAKAGQRVDETVTILDPKGNPNGKIVLQLFGTISAPKPTTIKIGVIKASIKKSGDWFGKSDPYVVLTLDKQKYQTQSKNNTQDPVWNEYFTFDMNRSPQTLLHVQLFDKDVIGSSKLADDWVNLGTVRSGQRPTQHIVQIKSGGELILEIGDSSPGSQVGPGAGIGSSLGGTSPSSRPPYQSTPGSSAPYSGTTPNYGTPSYGGSSPSYGGLGGPTSGGYSSPSYNTYGGSQPGYGAGTSSPSSNYNNAVPFPNSQPSSAYGSPSSRPGGYGSGGSPSGNYGSTTPGSSQLGGPLYSNPPGQGAGSYSPSSSYGAPAKPAASSKPPFVQVRVISADKIKSMDMGSKSDPYVVLTLDKQKFTTKVKNNTLTPEWNETFVFDLSKTAQTLLKVEMYDKDLIGSDKMHSDSILLNTARVGIPKVEQIALQTGGVLYLEVTGLNSPTPISTGSSSPVGGIGSSSPSSNRPPYSGAPAGPTSSPSSSYPPSGAPPSSNSPSSFAPSPASQAPSSRLNQVKPRPQIVKVTVRYARNLPSRISSSVLLSLDQQKYQTKIVPGENPVWNEPFSFDMGKQAQTLLKVSLKNESEIPVRTIGYELVDLKVVALGERAEAEIAIDNNRSSLVLELEGSSSPLAPASTRPSSTVPSSRPQQARTATRVRVGVLQARNLKNTDGWMAGKSDPYVALTLKDQKFQTKVVDNNLNPVWNEYFEFDMTKQDQTLLKLEVFDKDIVGQTKLGEEWVNLKTATFDRPVQSALKLSQGEVIVEIQAIA